MDKEIALKILAEMEKYRKYVDDLPDGTEPSDYCIRVCEAIFANAAGFKNRADWTIEI